MSKSVSRPAHRGNPRPFRAPNASIVKTIAGSISGHGKLAGRITLASGIAAGALVAVPAANAAPQASETTTVEAARAEPAPVVKAPTLEASATPAAMVTDIRQLERAVEAQQRRAEAARKAAEAKRQAAIAAKKAAAKAAAERREAAAERRKAEAEAKAFAASRTGKIEKAISVAMDQIGDPYVWGATGPSSFDCSGLTQYAFSAAGIDLPRVSRDQAAALPTIPNDQVKRGDLLFWGSPVYHVGIFLRWENGQAIMLHAPKPGASVREEAAWDGWFAGSTRQA